MSSAIGWRKDLSWRRYWVADDPDQSFIRELAQELFASFPGEEDSCENTGCFNGLYSILQGNVKDEPTLQRLYGVLQYRLGQMAIADGYVKQMEIPLPEGKLCHEFNWVAYMRKQYGDDKGRYHMIYDMLSECGLGVLFPVPPFKQGHYSQKGSIYLIAAIHYSMISLEDAKPKVQELVVSAREEKKGRRKRLRREARERKNT